LDVARSIEELDRWGDHFARIAPTPDRTITEAA
jgi:hypothetical protein